MNPLSPEGAAKSRAKTKAYVDAKNGVTPEILAGAASIFERYCGTGTRSGHCGTASDTPVWSTSTRISPEAAMADRCASIMATEAYEHRMDLAARQRRERRWYRRLYRWLMIWVLA